MLATPLANVKIVVATVTILYITGVLAWPTSVQIYIAPCRYIIYQTNA